MSETTAIQKRAVVLLSGGLDSATTLACALRDGYACYCLSVAYGQRHKFELQAAAKIAHALGAKAHKIVAIDLRAIGGSALTDDIEVPKDTPDLGIPVTYVPARNLVFMAVAAGYAEVLGSRDLFVGINAVDYSGYPDCRPAFVEAFVRAVNEGTKAGVEGRGLRVRAPLMELSKADIIGLGTELGVPFGITHSCYDPAQDGAACGRCASCCIRREGFVAAGVADPTRYHA